MFDGQKRGPNGVHSTAGTGCITRYVDLDRLVEVFLLNLPTFGKSEFVIHKVIIFLTQFDVSITYYSGSGEHIKKPLPTIQRTQSQCGDS